MAKILGKGKKESIQWRALRIFVFFMSGIIKAMAQEHIDPKFQFEVQQGKQ
ncbi:MAG: hypothetical protein WCJ84_06710 [Candidatus Peregrinibacteria bacterium]